MERDELACRVQEEYRKGGRESCEGSIRFDLMFGLRIWVWERGFKS